MWLTLVFSIFLIIPFPIGGGPSHVIHNVHQQILDRGDLGRHPDNKLPRD